MQKGAGVSAPNIKFRNNKAQQNEILQSNLLRQTQSNLTQPCGSITFQLFKIC
jgi:hypothetical protein